MAILPVTEFPQSQHNSSGTLPLLVVGLSRTLINQAVKVTVAILLTLVITVTTKHRHGYLRNQDGHKCV